MQLYYRGCLNFCNYSCSYCPFSKKIRSERILGQDKAQLMCFVEHIERISYSGAVQIIPYGEAMIHSYYWEAMAKLSSMPLVACVGIQSNFSFDVETFITRLQENNADITKLRLWGTFHPEMTSIEKFREHCVRLKANGIQFSVGIVGVPGQAEMIQAFRDAVPKDCYVWINDMEGSRRPYSEEEKDIFRKIDPFFERELRRLPSDVSDCESTYFVRGDGRMYACPISQSVIGDFYMLQNMEELYKLESKRICRSKYCHCYLAYNNRKKERNQLFGKYPAFRVPFLPKAVFFDIDGVLVPEGQSRISEETKVRLCQLSTHFPLYLATSRPLKEAVKILGSAMRYFRGGAFACGAQLMLWEGENRQVLFEKVYTIKEEVFLNWLENIDKAGAGYRLKRYEKEKQLYKCTIQFPTEKRALEFAERHRQTSEQWSDTRMFVENKCIEFVAQDADKKTGAEVLCEQLDITLEDIAFCGHDKEDKELLEQCYGIEP